MAEQPVYVGRFAPSPTGPLHFGSLVAALASFLDARRAGGRWLLRIEDIDPPREMPGASDAILRTLEAHGLVWDGPVLYQSQRSDAYLGALEALTQRHRLFPCVCTRSILGPGGSCGGRCAPREGEPHSLRLRLTPPRSFHDRVLGPQAPRDDRRDVVLRRRDGLFAYTLAVVVDDAWQGITDVLRGQDLLEETSVQLDLFDALDKPAPRYGHVPLLRNEAGTKLSKQTGAPGLDDGDALANLRRALVYLNQPPVSKAIDSVDGVLAAAAAHWDPARMAWINDADLVYPGVAAP
jgi:glutamyl-Q tRNA(Asp) synthetase